MMMIALITIKSSLVSVIESLCAQIYFECPDDRVPGCWPRFETEWKCVGAKV